MIVRRARIVALAGLLATGFVAAACEQRTDAEIEGRATFVATYIDLRRATVAGTLDDGVRDSILRAHGTTEEELRAYVEQHAEDPATLSDTWREIMDSLTARDSVAADTVPDPTDDVRVDTTDDLELPDTGFAETDSF